MEKVSIDRILSLKETNNKDFQECYNYLKNYVEATKVNDFYDVEILDLMALINKFLRYGAPIELDNEMLFKELIEYTDEFEQSIYKYKFNEQPEESEVTRNLIYQHLYSNLLKAYTIIHSYFQNQKEELLEFDGLIDYDISNKRKAVRIIQEAIELIENDPSLSKKSKKKILKYLSDTIQELNNPKTNWTNFFRKSAEVVIVLGALGSLTGGIESGNNLLKAQEKVEKAKGEIVKTSINLNYMNVESTFVINKPIEIENNEIKLIEQNIK